VTAVYEKRRKTEDTCENKSTAITRGVPALPIVKKGQSGDCEDGAKSVE